MWKNERENIYKNWYYYVYAYNNFCSFLLQDATAEADQSTPKNIRKRKTTQNDPSYGSFFLRIGAIGNLI